MKDTEEFLSPSEIAAILKVHVKTVHIWLRQGKLKGTKISYRTWRISRTALDEFLTGAGFASQKKIPESMKQGLSSDAVTVPLSGVEGTDSFPVEMKHFLKEIMKESPSDKK